MTPGTYWTLECDSTEQTFEEWGIGDARLSLQSQAPDELTFSLASSAFDADTSFSYNDTITIRKGRTRAGPDLPWTGGATYFVGQVVEVPRVGTGSSEQLQFKVQGPWRYLERLIFQQSWKSWNNTTEVYDTLWTSHVFLGTTQQNGTIHTTGAQITEILQYAIDEGASFQIGTVLTGVNFPIAEIKDVLSSECIRMVLRWHPDAVTWFDYSTSPPTIHCNVRSALTSVTLPIGSEPLAEVQLDRRDDLTVPFVKLNFERIDSVDGTPRLYVETQTAGDTGQKFGGLVSTVNLLGYQLTTARARIVTRAIAPTTTAWWKYRYPWLNDARITNLTIEPGSTDFRDMDNIALSTTNYPTELVSGQIAPWMQWSGSGIVYKRATVKATVVVKHTGTGAAADQYEQTESLTANIVATSLPYLGSTGREFSTVEEFSEGDAPPAGLATSLYNALSVVHYSGNLSLVETDCGDWFESQSVTSKGLGLKVNLSGGRSEWTTANALVQQVGIDLDSGTTTLTVGPPAHLGPQDLAQLTLINRFRFRYTAPDYRTTGEPESSGSTIELGEEVGESDSTSGMQRQAKAVHKQTTGRHFRFNTAAESDSDMGSTNNCFWDLRNGNNYATCGVDDTTGNSFMLMPRVSMNNGDIPTGKSVAFREINVCQKEGETFVEKRMLVFASEIYDPPA